MVSPEGRARTIAAFGEPLSPAQVVERICADVAARGLAAVLDYTRRLDGVALEPAAVRVSRAELQAAHESAEPAYLQTLGNVRDNILAFQRASSTATWRSSPPRASSWVLRYRAAAPGRRLRAGRGGGLSLDAVDDGRPGAGGGRDEIAVVVPPTRSAATTTTCWRLATLWA